MKNLLKYPKIALACLLFAPLHGAQQAQQPAQQQQQVQQPAQPAQQQQQNPQQLAAAWNAQLNGLANGQFQVDNNGHITYTGGQTPDFAVKHVLDSLGITKGFGTGGVDPLKEYTYQEWGETSLFAYFCLRGYDCDTWHDRGGQGTRLGVTILRWAKKDLGQDVFKELHEHELKVAARNDFWDSLRNQIVPELIKIGTQPKVIALSFGIVFLLIGLPLIIWNGSKALLSWIFARRPTILSDKDSDIYGNFFHRMFWKYPQLPAVTVNSELEDKLNALVKANRLITKKNKGGLFRDPKKTPYPHIIAYGEAGVGKTLFAKNLAKQSGMHFMYLTVADLSQLSEEEALETLKSFFAYARRYAPCVLIIDEADRLFAGSDVKSQKLATLFQREFAKAVDENIQLFFITNYPWTFPDPILNRMSKILEFDAPNFETQKKLFTQHLRIALRRQKKDISVIDDLVEDLDESLLKGLVGRDIEAISVDFSLAEKQDEKTLSKAIKSYKDARAALKVFKEKSHPKPVTTPKKTKSLWS